MLEFMEYVQQAWYETTQWNQENSYAKLTSTARALLEFETPRGVRLHLSSLASSNLATSYTLGSIGLVDGSLSYLYTSHPLTPPAQTSAINLRHVIHGYHQIRELRKPEEPYMWEQWYRGHRIDHKSTLLCGRLYLPQSTLEALYLRRLSPTQQLRLSAVSDSKLKNGGTILGLHQYDTGKYSIESLYSTDGGLIGARGLYNFGPDPRTKSRAPPYPEELLKGRFSAGAELYYGSLNKSGGVSLGGRFATLPAHTGTPFTSTLTLNPLVGNVSITHAVKAGPNLSLCSKFDFNIYSYESEFMLGCELWRVQKQLTANTSPRMLSSAETGPTRDEPPRPNEFIGVLKARIDQNWGIGLLWEGRVKEFLFTLGSSIDIRKTEQPFRAIGVEVQYSS
ncbi:Mitochondrial distribution and morphology protein 10 [Podosphaera aphanis]|nr:Mitochondrial distribution and morphology protein 10 [Podosphaera aphanis]